LKKRREEDGQVWFKPVALLTKLIKTNKIKVNAGCNQVIP
jgi:hypothetical protein